MKAWLSELDDLLRGRKTEAGLLAEGTEQLRIGPFLTATVILGLVYGVFMGLYAVLNHTPPCYQQLLASTVKVPALFLLTLLVTFPSLYVFSALLGTRLSPLGTFRIVVASLAVTLALLASVGPITGFFSVTTSSYPFMKLLNFLLFAMAGVIGVKFLLTALRRSEGTGESKSSPFDSDAGASSEAQAKPSWAMPAAAEESRGTAIPTARPVQRPGHGKKAGKVVGVWVILYAFVGAQMGWVLRPLIGSPDLEFAWFRPRESNIFVDILRTMSELFHG